MDEAKKRRTSEKSGQSDQLTDSFTELRTCIFDGLTRLWHTQTLFDYTLRAGDKSFRIHRTVLASVSDYFYAMFTSGMKESQQDFAELKGVSSRMLELLLQFIYTGDLCVTEQNVVELLNAAAHLQIATVVKLCLAFMNDNITIENCIEMLDISRLHASEKDFEKLEDFVAENFAQLISSKNYHKLSYDSLKGLLCRSELLCGPEYDLYKGVRAWFEHDTKSRAKYIIPLMEHIRFPLMTKSEIEEIESLHPSLLEDAVIQKHLTEAQEYVSLPTHQRVLHQTPRTRLRTKPSLLVIQDEWNQNWFSFQPDHSMWYGLNPAEFKETCAAECIVVNDFLIVCGGMVTEDVPEDKVTGKCFIFDPREYKWTKLASMAIPRQDFALLEHKGYLYALAGSMIDEISVTEKIERYSFETNQWETFASMFPSWRASYCVSACVLDDRIYVCDGSPEDIVEGTTPNRMAYLDIATQTWNIAAISVDEKCGFPMWHYKDKIYTLENDNAVVNTPMITWYEPKTGVCGTVLCSEVLSKAKIVAVENKIFFINGCLMDGQDNYLTNLCTEVVIDPSTHVASVRKLDPFPDKESTQYCVRIRLPCQYQEETLKTTS